MYRLLLAFRYIVSRPIQLLGIIGVTLGVWALIVIVSIFSGFIREIRNHLRQATSDLSVVRIPVTADGEEMLRVVESDPEVVAATARLVWYGLLYPADAETDRRIADGSAPAGPNLLGLDTRFVALLGVDPERERRTTGFGRWLAQVEDEGLRVPDDVADPLATKGSGEDARHFVMPSLPRARLENVERGSAMLLATGHEAPGSDSYVSQVWPLEVAGAFETQHLGFDGFNTFVHIDALRDLLGVGPVAINEIAIKLKDPARVDVVGPRIQSALDDLLGPFGGPIVRTWEQANAVELKAFEHQRGLMRIVLMVILVVAAFLIYATLSMMVTEKTRDIGILTALGGTPQGVSQVFLLCGLVIAGIGSVLGTVLGCVSAVRLDAFNVWLRETFAIDLFPASVYFLKHVPYDLDPLWIGLVVLTAMGFGLLAAGIPALRAAWQDPLRSLRYE
jgi:lipoprotein-releasing system permease protein